jgi:rhodanese-related sulfurtransferase
MKWDNVIKPAEIMTEEQAKAYMDSRKTGSYQLLDVRLHEEYEEEHLPGAILVPLNELMEGAGELDPQKPTIVYCRSGGRSKAASQWLLEQGFKEVYDISDNIVDWLGIQLEGEYDYDLNLIRNDVEFPDAFTLAYAMEEGLQKFYLELEKNESDEKKREVYNQLAGYEDLHKENLKKGFETAKREAFDIESAINSHDDMIEGGNVNKKSPFTVASQM